MIHHQSLGSSSFVVFQDLDLRKLLHDLLSRRDVCSIKVLVENQSCKYLLCCERKALWQFGSIWVFSFGIRKVHFGCKRYFLGVGKSDLGKEKIPLCQSGSIWVSWWWWCSAGPANWGHLILLIALSLYPHFCHCPYKWQKWVFFKLFLSTLNPARKEASLILETISISFWWIQLSFR